MPGGLTSYPPSLPGQGKGRGGPEAGGRGGGAWGNAAVGLSAASRGWGFSCPTELLPPARLSLGREGRGFLPRRLGQRKAGLLAAGPAGEWEAGGASQAKEAALGLGV